MKVQGLNHSSIGLVALLVLAVVGPIAIVIGGYTAAQSYLDEMRAELATKRETLARLKSSIEHGNQMLAKRDPQAERTLTGDFLSGAADAIIAAELQSRLRTLAIASGVELNSANALPGKIVDANSYLGLRVTLRGEVADVQKLLHEIESGSPLLFVERLGLRLDTWPIRSPDPTKDGAPALVADMDIFGPRSPIRASDRQPDVNRPEGAPLAVKNSGPPIEPPAPRSSGSTGRRRL